jgi:hypothetical protein
MCHWCRGVPATIAAFGRKFVVRGGQLTTLEGEWPHPRLVIIEFFARRCRGVVQVAGVSENHAAKTKKHRLKPDHRRWSGVGGSYWPKRTWVGALQISALTQSGHGPLRRDSVSFNLQEPLRVDKTRHLDES